MAPFARGVARCGAARRGAARRHAGGWAVVYAKFPRVRKRNEREVVLWHALSACPTTWWFTLPRHVAFPRMMYHGDVWHQVGKIFTSRRILILWSSTNSRHDRDNSRRAARCPLDSTFEYITGVLVVRHYHRHYREDQRKRVRGRRDRMLIYGYGLMAIMGSDNIEPQQ